MGLVEYDANQLADRARSDKEGDGLYPLDGVGDDEHKLDLGKGRGVRSRSRAPCERAGLEALLPGVKLVGLEAVGAEIGEVALLAYFNFRNKMGLTDADISGVAGSADASREA